MKYTHGLLLVLALVCIFTSSVSSFAKDEVQMSENWGHYFADMGGNQASIVFDDGISSTINQSTLPNSYKIKIILSDLTDAGFPTNEEAKKLSEMSEKAEEIIKTHQGLYLGRVTTNGVRWELGLVPENTDQIAAEIKAKAKEIGYSIDISFDADPDKRIYWDDLYPTNDDRRVMGDMSVISSLMENGDDLLTPRIVDHWTYFQDKAVAKIFLEWAIDHGYQNVNIEKGGTLFKRTYCVLTQHESNAQIGEISKHTLAHDRKARELGGDYDGWETLVVKAKE